ncbi:MAG: iron-sulfur cluster assembly accessory protein [Gammaproteobacteria bacterium]|nr:iron-sulfur cluster assembly accessory protein [Gammaproteobacteria bacterium]
MITLSPKAVDHICLALKKRGKGVGIRLGVKPTGCSGYSYKLEYVDAVKTDDVVFHEGDIKVIVDAGSLPIIDGTLIDYVRTGLNEGFSFSNPKEKDRCGCGESFRV